MRPTTLLMILAVGLAVVSTASGRHCKTDHDCPKNSYCMNDPTKTAPFLCHRRKTSLKGSAFEDATANLPKDVKDAAKQAESKAQQDEDAIKMALDKYTGVVHGVFIPVGLLVALFGYRLVGPTIFLAGAAAGGYTSYLLASTYPQKAGVPMAYDAKIYVVIIVPIVLAIICGLVVLKLRKLGVFLAGAAGGVVGALVLNSAVLNKIPQNTWIQTNIPALYLIIASVVLGVIGGVLALKLERVILVIATAIVGSFATVWGVGYFASGSNFSTVLESFIRNPASPVSSLSPSAAPTVQQHNVMYAYLAAFVVCAVISTFVQFKYTSKKQAEKDGTRDSLLPYNANEGFDTKYSTNADDITGFYRST